MKTLLVLLLSISIANAGDSVVVLAKGAPAPFDGVLFSREMEKQIRQIDLDNDYLKRQNTSLIKLNTLSEQENTIITKRYENMQLKANELAEKQVKMENNSFWKTTLYFMSGALLTGVVAYGAARAGR
jgi:hypothetical protein